MKTIRSLIIISVFACSSSSWCGQAVGEVAGWPAEVKEIRYTSRADSTKQSALFLRPEDSSSARPLLVGLHTWGGDYRQTSRTYGAPYARWCIEKNWVLVCPNFRGPNSRPEACGSELVVKDVMSAVEFARRETKVDPQRIYLVGVSGGGHLSLLMAGRHPEVWAGVSAWVPITDLALWHKQCGAGGSRFSKYARDMEAVCLGAPGSGEKVDEQYGLRSPLTWLPRARGLAIDINAGILDGHVGSVPVDHSLSAFNRLALKEDRIQVDDIESIRRSAKIPEHLKFTSKDPLYGKKVPLFRAESNKARVTLFQGGHEIVPEAALSWLEKQSRTDVGR